MDSNFLESSTKNFLAGVYTDGGSEGVLPTLAGKWWGVFFGKIRHNKQNHV